MSEKDKDKAGRYLKASHGKYNQEVQINAKVSETSREGLKALAQSFGLSVNAFLNELGAGNFEVIPLSGES
jgi:hypothetical protein